MNRVTRYREYGTGVAHEWVFANDPKYANDSTPRGGWYGFNADENGVVDRAAITECARNNFDFCCIMRPWGHLVERRFDYWLPGLMVCDCLEELEMHGGGRDIHCYCGRSYTSSGQLLAPRSQWGEETGETAVDYDRGVNDPEHAFR